MDGCRLFWLSCVIVWMVLVLLLVGCWILCLRCVIGWLWCLVLLFVVLGFCWLGLGFFIWFFWGWWLNWWIYCWWSVWCWVGVGLCGDRMRVGWGWLLVGWCFLCWCRLCVCWWFWFVLCYWWLMLVWNVWDWLLVFCGFLVIVVGYGYVWLDVLWCCDCFGWCRLFRSCCLVCFWLCVGNLFVRVCCGCGVVWCWSCCGWSWLVYWGGCWEWLGVVVVFWYGLVFVCWIWWCGWIVVCIVLGWVWWIGGVMRVWVFIGNGKSLIIVLCLVFL